MYILYLKLISSVLLLTKIIKHWIGFNSVQFNFIILKVVYYVQVLYFNYYDISLIFLFPICFVYVVNLL